MMVKYRGVPEIFKLSDTEFVLVSQSRTYSGNHYNINIVIFPKRMCNCYLRKYFLDYSIMIEQQFYYVQDLV